MPTNLAQLPEVKALKTQQRRYLLEYIATNNGTQSAIKAGYSKHTAGVTASKLLNTPNIKRALEACNKVLAEENAITTDYITSRLQTIVDGDKTTNSDKIRALELLGKWLNMWKDSTSTNIALFSDGAIDKLLSRRVDDKLQTLDVTHTRAD